MEAKLRLELINPHILSQERQQDNHIIGLHKLAGRRPQHIIDLRKAKGQQLIQGLVQHKVEVPIPGHLLPQEVIQLLLEVVPTTEVLPLLEVVQVIAGVPPHQGVAHRTADHLHPYPEVPVLQGDRQEAEVEEEDNHYISTQQRELNAPFFISYN